MGDAKVTAIRTARDEAAADVIEELEGALEYARENPCHSVCIFLMGRDGDNKLYRSTAGRTPLIGALAQMQHDLMGGE